MKLPDNYFQLEDLSDSMNLELVIQFVSWEQFPIRKAILEMINLRQIYGIDALAKFWRRESFYLQSTTEFIVDYLSSL